MIFQIQRASVVIYFFALIILSLVYPYSSNAQETTSDADGVKITIKDNIKTSFDEFTGEIIIAIEDTLSLSSFYEKETKSEISTIMPMYTGNESDINDDYQSEENFLLMAYNKGVENYLSEVYGEIPVHYLIDGKRNSKNGNYLSNEYQTSKVEILIIRFSKKEWEKIINSDTTKYRVAQKVFSLDKNTKELMSKILIEYKSLKSDFKKKDERSEEAKSKDTEYEEDFFVVVEDMPELKGDFSQLQKKFNYPEEARKAGIEGKVVIQFIVTENTLH